MEKGDGRLLRNHGGVWRVLAHVQRRLAVYTAILLFASPFASWAITLPPSPTRPDPPYTYEKSLSYCRAMEDWNNAAAAAYRAEGASDYYYQITKHCTMERPANTGPQWYQWNGRTNNGGFGSITFDITAGGGCDPSQATPQGCPTPPGDICKSRPTRGGIMGSNLSICFQGCTYKPTNPLDGTDGGLRTCVAGVGGACSTQATYAATGGTCGDGPGTDTTPPPPPPPAPKLCGGGSCYDPNTGKGCALDANGNQVCMDVKPGAPGGCISSGETTLCSGNPPPSPPADKVPDPPTDIAGSDKYSQQPINGSGGGGSVSNTTINNYNNGMSGGDGTPNNGGTAGDSGTPTGGDPAPGSSTAGPPNTASGGGDCGSPPLVTGDAALAMIAKQQWLTRCKGDGSTSNDADTSVPGLDGIGEGPGAGFFKDGTLGLDKLDDSGFGSNNTCPKFPTIAIESLGYVMDTQPNGWCEILGAVRATMPWLGAFFALLILLGGNKR